SFLSQYFKKYVEYDFTAKLEDELDDISSGALKWQKVLSEFWGPFKTAIDSTKDLTISEVIEKVQKDLENYLFSSMQPHEVVKTCPKCGHGALELKLGRFGAFLGCSNYPECSYTKQLVTASDDTSDSQEVGLIENKILGTDPKTNLEVHLKKGPYGFYFQWGTGAKPKRVPAPKNIAIDTLTLEDALKIGRFPESLGFHPQTKEDVSIGIGRFGPYIKYKDKFISIPKTDDITTIAMDRCLELIAKRQEKDALKGIVDEKPKAKKAAPKKATKPTTTRTKKTEVKKTKTKKTEA
ncbi:MAG TPA: topoisomerase C-terminal repeat-containing protein, partial [Alphaproteobacteria bacterium]|nr:topoisomerase C-terminal repeat-containing protein [Alphaproteobacteria bacterium]